MMAYETSLYPRKKRLESYRPIRRPWNAFQQLFKRLLRAFQEVDSEGTTM